LTRACAALVELRVELCVNDRDGRLADWQQTERATKSMQSAFADCLQYKQIEFGEEILERIVVW